MSIKSLLDRLSWQQRRLNEIKAIYGAQQVGDALSLAIEAGKYGISEDELGPMARSYHMLQALGIPPLPGETFWQWGIRQGIITKEIQLEVAQADLLGTKGPAN